jgi:hypothetical protein
MPTAKVSNTTTIVEYQTCFLVGQETFFNSALDSRRKAEIFSIDLPSPCLDFLIESRSFSIPRPPHSLKIKKYLEAIKPP